jgi:uncharacterized protein (DUF58 family)
VERLRARIAEGIRHRATPLGVMVLTLLLSSGVLAVATSQNVFFLLLSLLLAAILISSLVNRLMLAGLEIRLQPPPHAMEGRPLRCALLVENRKAWLASFALEVAAPNAVRFHIPCLRAGETLALALEMNWKARGLPPPVVLDVSTRFPFGFSARRTRVSLQITEPLYPSIDPAPGFAEFLHRLDEMARATTAAALEVSHLRELRPGDAQRDLAWRQSARSLALLGRPLVKQRTGAEGGALRLLLDQGTNDFERTVRLAAYVVWELHYKNTNFVLAWENEEFAIGDRADAYTVLKALAVVQAMPAVALPNDPSYLLLSDRVTPFLAAAVEPVPTGGGQNNHTVNHTVNHTGTSVAAHPHQRDGV